MKKVSYLLLLLFLAFLFTPTVVTYIDKNIDVTLAFTASEEENTSKTQPGMEYNIQETNPYYTSIHFLQEQSLYNHFYKEGFGLVFLDVISPPPKQA